jgi:hypothetical protein
LVVVINNCHKTRKHSQHQQQATIKRVSTTAAKKYVTRTRICASAMVLLLLASACLNYPAKHMQQTSSFFQRLSDQV